MVWYGMVWYGTVCHGMVWYGIVSYRIVSYGMVCHGMVLYGMVCHGMVWYCWVWYGMVWHVVLCFGVVWCASLWHFLVWYGWCRSLACSNCTLPSFMTAATTANASCRATAPIPSACIAVRHVASSVASWPHSGLSKQPEGARKPHRSGGASRRKWVRSSVLAPAYRVWPIRMQWVWSSVTVVGRGCCGVRSV